MSFPKPSIIKRLPLASGILAAALAFASCASAQSYSVTNLVSDGSVPATTTDPNFINPWAMSISSTWWIATAGTGYDYAISSATDLISFKVIVPAFSNISTATGIPTGSVSASTATGMLLPNGTKASFLFSTIDGTISGWNSKLGTANAVALIAINNNAAGAIYTGLAILNTSTNSYILAPNFGTGNKIEVYDNTFAPAALAGNFTDPSLPAGYSPYSVHVIGTQVFVAYVQRSTTTPYKVISGAGNGIVDVFDNTGKFVARVATGGNLNAPWGVAVAPSTFGIFSNDILIGNFGDGVINAFDPTTYAFLGQLIDGTGKTLAYPSLWELQTGGAPAGGVAGNVYFTAGLTGEAHGLLAQISNSTTPTGVATFAMAPSTTAMTVTAGSSSSLTISIAPVNNFSGSVALSCSGLPIAVACTFAPPSLPVLATAPAIANLTITTTKSSAALRMPGKSSAIGFALLLPFAGLFGLRRRSRLKLFAILGAGLILFTSAGVLSGCAGPSGGVVGTPTGAQSFTVVATSGTVTRQSTVTLTVQ